MAKVETWQTDHERRCDERQAAMGREIKGLRTDAKSARNAFYAVLMGLLAFLAVEAYHSLQHPQPPGTITTTTTSR